MFSLMLERLDFSRANRQVIQLNAIHDHDRHVVLARSTFQLTEIFYFLNISHILKIRFAVN